MNRLTKVLFAMALFVSLSITSMAQTSDQVNVSATANVAADLSVTPEIDLEFGNIIVGSSKILAPNIMSITTSADGISGGESFGVARIDYVIGESIDVEITVPGNLVADGASGNNTMPFYFSIDGAQNTASGASAILVDDTTIPDGSDDQSFTPLTGGAANNWGGSTNTYSVSNITVPDGGTLYVVIGGEVTAATDQAIGQYTGDITIETTLPN